LGDVCTSTCVSNPGVYGQTFACLGGTCQYPNKVTGAPCTVNGECQSQNCTGNVCIVSPLGGRCSSSLNCDKNLYCDSFNSTCYAVSNAGQQCGLVQINWSNVPCAAGLSCVMGSNATISTCVANAALGQACSAAVQSVMSAPACGPTTVASVFGSYQCINNLCTLFTGVAQGGVCNATLGYNCQAPQLTCQYPAGATSGSGTCQPVASVACSTQQANCNAGQKCSCGGTATTTGTCAVDNTNVFVNCANQILALQNCLLTSCGSVSSAYVAYDSFSCATKSCLLPLNGYYCCLNNTVSGFVGPANLPTNFCSNTPTPAPTTTTTSSPTATTGPTSTPAPGKSSKSPASTVAVSIVVMILAVIAYLL